MVMASIDALFACPMEPPNEISGLNIMAVICILLHNLPRKYFDFIFVFFERKSFFPDIDLCATIDLNNKWARYANPISSGQMDMHSSCQLIVDNCNIDDGCWLSVRPFSGLHHLYL